MHLSGMRKSGGDIEFGIGVRDTVQHERGRGKAASKGSEGWASMDGMVMTDCMGNGISV